MAYSKLPLSHQPISHQPIVFHEFKFDIFLKKKQNIVKLYYIFKIKSKKKIVVTEKKN